MSEAKIFQIAEARKDKQAEMKREYERFLFKRLLGCYTVIEKLGLKSVELHDISKSGCHFTLDAREGKFGIGEEMDLRLYFSNKSFLPTRITIKRVSQTSEFGIDKFSYGCEFDTTLSTHPALLSFVNFVESYATFAKEDKGDKQVWYL